MIDFPLGRIGFGCVPIGGFRGYVSADQAVGAVRRAFELGVRYFDVAPHYGNGRAELVLGHAMRDIPRGDWILSTKVGRWLEPAGATGQPARTRPGEGAPFNSRFDYSRDGTMRALEQSLMRIGTERIDLVYIHDLDAQAHGSEEVTEEMFRIALAGALPALHELKRAGVIRGVGVGINQPHWAERWIREADLDMIMLAGRVTLLNRDAIPGILAECRRRGITYVAAGAFNGGLLARGASGVDHFNYRPVPSHIAEAYGQLVALARETGTNLKAAAIQFVLRHEQVASVVMGAASAAEVEENLRLANAPVPEAFWRTLADWNPPPS
jgi:D-threo-aldose 1-dehydrogenase